MMLRKNVCSIHGSLLDTVKRLIVINDLPWEKFCNVHSEIKKEYYCQERERELEELLCAAAIYHNLNMEGEKKLKVALREMASVCDVWIHD